ncbi:MULTISPECIES: GNAT family N-acetyltransferase [Runella]|uniref:GNAT superfamily N-acetyltransferase n=1 Tax=Runella defluvii TaxID=370973 RepID=A0A7W5ZRF7_9BACT|nr:MULTISPECIES: GNAT family N-acetyltransferase [Runella]MBB3840686.1 GNAT superfamily N-acetyltransferase [Runella defluvii]HAK78839.1 N-acetyltransferase [Runella sp.]HAO48964.1 N-acetyltransferase [Runella sp.]
MQITIRKGTPEDVPQVFALVQELALYERAPEQVTNTPEMMLKDGFGPEPIFGLFVAEVDGQIVGISLYYYRYSTWKGKRLYLEDLIVTESMRGHGLGKMLLDTTVQEAKDTNCTGVMWQVLDWNEPSIKFYERYGARLDGEWINCHLDF